VSVDIFSYSCNYAEKKASDMNYMKYLSLAILGFVTVYASGCATLIRGDTQKIRVETDPPGATVKVNDKTYTSPATVPLKRSEEYKVMIAKEGYRTVTFGMKATWDGASLPGVILPGGSVSVAADRASGADLKFYDLPIIKLEPTNGVSDPLDWVQYRNKLVTRAEYDKLMQEEQRDRWNRVGE
jgi:hypothetical protein